MEITSTENAKITAVNESIENTLGIRSNLYEISKDDNGKFWLSITDFKLGENVENIRLMNGIFHQFFPNK